MNEEKPNGKNPNGWFLGHNKRLQVKESQVSYQPTVEPLPLYPIGLVL